MAFLLNFFLNRLDNLRHLGDTTEELVTGGGGAPPSVTGTPIGLLLALTREI